MYFDFINFQLTWASLRHLPAKGICLQQTVFKYIARGNVLINAVISKMLNLMMRNPITECFSYFASYNFARGKLNKKASDLFQTCLQTFIGR